VTDFSLLSISDPELNPFDRQERMSWWDAKKVSSSTLLVAGAGATGNETLKNLALLGVRRILVADFDKIALSNLSRTVLFARNDLGRSKARIAAKRTRQMCLAEDPQIDCFDGDIVWDLGTGVYMEMDLVFGCLDNAEARLAINRQCWLANTPWIDSGILELGAHVATYIPLEGPCYQCGIRRETLASARTRYSCDDFKKSLLAEGKLPTVQVTSALAAALQVQEGMKLLCGRTAKGGRYFHYDGNTNTLDTYDTQATPNCIACTTYPGVHALGASAEMTVREFLTYVSDAKLSGRGATLDLRGDRTFVYSIRCPGCGRARRLLKPSFKLFDTDAYCPRCRRRIPEHTGPPNDVPAEKTLLPALSLQASEDPVLNLRLRDLGIPWYHVVSVQDAGGEYRYYLLGADRSRVFPSITMQSRIGRSQEKETTVTRRQLIEVSRLRRDQKGEESQWPRSR